MALVSDFIEAEKITDIMYQIMLKPSLWSMISQVKYNCKTNKINIPILGATAVGDYVPGTNMSINNLGSSHVSIDLDQSKYINDYLDEVDTAMAAQDVLKQAMINIKNANSSNINKFTLKKYFTDAGINPVTYGLGVTTAPITIDSTNIDDYLTSICEALDTLDLPENGRYVVLPPYCRKALTLNNTYVAATTDEQSRRKGFSGMYASLEVHISNALPSGVADSLAAGETGIVYGLIGAGAVGFNFDKQRTVPAEQRFGEFLQAAWVYGAGATNANFLGKGVVKRG